MDDIAYVVYFDKKNEDDLFNTMIPADVHENNIALREYIDERMDLGYLPRIISKTPTTDEYGLLIELILKKGPYEDNEEEAPKEEEKPTEKEKSPERSPSPVRRNRSPSPKRSPSPVRRNRSPSPKRSPSPVRRNTSPSPTNSPRNEKQSDPKSKTKIKVDQKKLIKGKKKKY